MSSSSPIGPAARGLVLAFAVGGACLVAPREAHAGDPAPSLTAQSEAQARFQTGLKYYDARDFESARLAFTQAYAVLQKPGILLNLALSELYTNRPVDAINHLERYLAEPDLPVDKRDRAKKAYDEAYKKTGHVTLGVLPGTVLKVDGVGLAPPLPAVLHVAPGSRVLDATRGKGTKSVTLQAQPGEKTSADLRIDDEAAGPMPAATDPPTSKPSPTSPGPASLEPQASTPPRTEPPPVEDKKANVPRLILGIAGAVAVVGGAVSIGLSFGAKSEADDALTGLNVLAPQLPAGRNGCVGVTTPTCVRANELGATYSEAEDRRKVLLWWTGVVPVGVGVGLLVGAYLWPKSSSSIGTRLAPGPTLAGLSLVSTY